MKIAIYPGSFDPITSGHLNIIQRAANIFDKLIVCVMVNSGKSPLFSQEERVELIRRTVKDLPNVEVDSSDMLLADYARHKGSCVIIKGLRAGSDFENEFQQLDDTHFRISGSMAFDDLLWELDLDQFEDEVDAATVGGWVTEVLERIPEIGDTFTWKNLNVTVEALEDMRVTQIKLEVLPPIEPENNDE